jgi:hypothetical protein
MPNNMIEPNYEKFGKLSLTVEEQRLTIGNSHASSALSRSATSSSSSSSSFEDRSDLFFFGAYDETFVRTWISQTRFSLRTETDAKDPQQTESVARLSKPA